MSSKQIHMKKIGYMFIFTLKSLEQIPHLTLFSQHGFPAAREVFTEQTGFAGTSGCDQVQHGTISFNLCDVRMLLWSRGSRVAQRQSGLVRHHITKKISVQFCVTEATFFFFSLLFLKCTPCILAKVCPFLWHSLRHLEKTYSQLSHTQNYNSP